MGHYSKALSFCEKGLPILQKRFSPYHPDTVETYHTMGSVYYKIGEYSKSLFYLKNALDCWEHSLPSNHPRIQRVRQNIKIVKQSMK